jgi:hypothetical protein
VELLPVAVLAVVAALVTLVLCDLAGAIARTKGRSYWTYFVLGLLLWFPSLLLALRLPAPEGVAASEPGRPERVVATVLMALAALAAAAGLAAAVAYAP